MKIGPGTTLLVPDENSSLSLDGGNAEEAPRLGVDKPKYKRVKRNGRWVNVPVTPASGSKAVKQGVQKKKVSAPPARKTTVIPARK